MSGLTAIDKELPIKCFTCDKPATLVTTMGGFDKEFVTFAECDKHKGAFMRAARKVSKKLKKALDG